MPAKANYLVELSAGEKMKSSDVVAVGTVVAVTPPRPWPHGSTATLDVLAMLKGPPEPRLEVNLRWFTAEDAIDCCEVGAIYAMFLKRAPDGALVSINGRHGLIRIAPAENDPKFEVIGNGRD